jgi:hypothetical protein
MAENRERKPEFCKAGTVEERDLPAEQHLALNLVGLDQGERSEVGDPEKPKRGHNDQPSDEVLWSSGGEMVEKKQ